ncbi:chromate transporter, partial [Microbacteriaceae bacterium K1510]|nr:chromate transporter [Microbacteriaceae bacterium K1510]
MIPLFYTECVKRYNWVSAEEFGDYLALGNALPGPIATKMAAYVGYRVKGWLGAFVAISAVILPVLLLMIGLLQFVGVMKESPAVHGMIQAIQPVIAVMTGVLTYEFLSKGWKEAKNKGGISVVLALSLVALLFLDMHPGLVVGIALFVSFVYSTWAVRQAKKPAAGKGVD